MKMIVWGLLLSLLLSLQHWIIQAQESAATVPDVTGLNIPAAVARLNEAGLAQGAILVQLVTESEALTPGLIVAQSLRADSPITASTRVDLTVVRTPNVTLVYDDNDLTLVNRSAATLDLRGTLLTTSDGTTATFSADRWGDTLRGNQCAQVWSVARLSAKPVEGCAAIQNWLSTQNTSDHFWTGSSGSTQFAITQNGEQRALCTIGGSFQCELYVDEVANAAEITSFVHFAYTQDWWVVHNTSADQWMLLEGFTLFTTAPTGEELSLVLSDPVRYESLHPVAQVARLAPGQCLLFVSSTPTGTGPAAPACLVVGQRTISEGNPFWASTFEFESLSDARRRICPAATLDRITVCIMPR